MVLATLFILSYFTLGEGDNETGNGETGNMETDMDQFEDADPEH